MYRVEIERRGADSLSVHMQQVSSSVKGFTLLPVDARSWLPQTQGIRNEELFASYFVMWRKENIKS